MKGKKGKLQLDVLRPPHLEDPYITFLFASTVISSSSSQSNSLFSYKLKRLSKLYRRVNDFPLSLDLWSTSMQAVSKRGSKYEIPKD